MIFVQKIKVFEINDIFFNKKGIKNIRDYALEDLFSKEHFEKAIKIVSLTDIPLNNKDLFSKQLNERRTSFDKNF